MDDGLVPMSQISVGRNGDVLILVVVDDGLVRLGAFGKQMVFELS